MQQRFSLPFFPLADRCSHFSQPHVYSPLFCQVPAFSFLSDVDKFFVFSGYGHQLVMRALLDDLTVIDHKNLVGMAHSFQPMGNHDDGLVLGQLGDGLHQLFFIFRVNIGCSFVPISTTSANPHKTGTFQKSKDN